MFKKIFKNLKINFVTGLIIGAVLAGSGVYAVALDSSNNVTYDNSTSKASSTNVQDALDELYNNTFFSEPRYDFGTPNASSSTDFKEVIASSDSNVFVRKIGSQLSVCLYRNEQLFCLKNGVENWGTNQKILTAATFPEAACDTSSSSASCYDASFLCNARSDGYVYCNVSDADLSCRVLADGSVDCS